MTEKMDRREFMKTAGAAGAVLVAGPFGPIPDGDHFVPADKKLTREWVEALFARGEPAWHSGDDLKTIGMPIGGICAGQLYLTGDGRLTGWDIFNQNENTGYGKVNYEVGRAAEMVVRGGKVVPSAPVDQGFALRVQNRVRTLDRRGFPEVRFCGEYPVGRVNYADASCPVSVELEAFSPFVPLDAAESSIPGTVLRYTVRNTSGESEEVTLLGWLQNAVCLHSGERFGRRLGRRNQGTGSPEFTGLVASVREVQTGEDPEDPPEVFADFEGDDYGDWTVEGEAFGKGPARGTLPQQQKVSGFQGKGLVNTFLGGDGPLGKLTSPTFTIERPCIGFLIGGGGHAGKTCVNLIVDGKVVRTATGKSNERLEPHTWNVEDLKGKKARIQIVDDASGGWGHINCDQIEFRDSPMVVDPGPLHLQPDYGDLSLAIAGRGFNQPEMPETFSEIETGELAGVIGRTFTLAPGEEEEVVFVLSWFMPNLYRGEDLVGNRYAERFDGARAVATHVLRNLRTLSDRTRLWHDTYYDSTLPRWLLDRIHSTVSNLATGTCQWWRNGRFWAWEGVGCCRGTCGHVWNYEHALARLFPALERSVREMQDFAPGVGFYPETGAIGFRGEGWTLWAGDSQGGYVLKAYREHLMSSDDGFLRRNWTNIRKATQFLIDQDGDGDGLIEGKQHQTYDQDYHGPNTMVGSLYLGALRAAAEMAKRMNEDDFAALCNRIALRGSEASMKRLFDGEYFIQEVDLEKHPEWQYGMGCLADQMFGQGWAHQVGLGYLYPEEAVRKTLESIWKYCWAPDIGPQNRVHGPERWFASPGEAGLFTCTWPKTKHLGPRSTRYRNEIWTGIEYQVAGHMAWEGMVTEALAICRGIHERYHPSRHNPYNEVECGDHYARALASWGVLIGLAGFELDGPAGHIGFAPRITPEDFRCAFTGPEGWGSISQKRDEKGQTSRIEVRHGRLRVKTLAFDIPDPKLTREVKAIIGESTIAPDWDQDHSRMVITLPEDILIEPDESLNVKMRW